MKNKNQEKIKEKIEKEKNLIITITSPDRNSFLRIDRKVGGYKLHYLNCLFSRKELEGLKKIIDEALKVKN